MLSVRNSLLVVILSVLSLANSQPPPQPPPSEAVLTAAKSSIEAMIKDPNNEVNINGVTPGREMPFIGGLVRLAFHDCVGAGGCDGCINHDLPDNAGLFTYTEHLDTLYDENFEGQLSRADFYALASMTALELATCDDDTDDFKGFENFKIGRKSCSNLNSVEDDSNEEFPETEFNFEQTTSYFSRIFNFNPREVIALLGAHTLGRARTENSGYEGPWVRGPANEKSTLNNRFYREIVERPWEQVEVVASGEVQWQIPGPPPDREIVANTAENRNEQQPNMLFNSDSSLSVTLNPDPENHGRVNCVMCTRNLQRPQCCPRHAHHHITAGFSANNSRWLDEFTDVFLKMIDHNDAPLVAAPSLPPVECPRRGGRVGGGGGGGGGGRGGRGGGANGGGRGGNGGGRGGRGGGRQGRDALKKKVGEIAAEFQVVEDEIKKLNKQFN